MKIFLYLWGGINLLVIVWILRGYYKEYKLDKIQRYDRRCQLETEIKERRER